MRLFVLILAGIGMTGCVAQQTPEDEVELEPVYAEAQAAALLFEPPVAMGQPALDLDRPGRAEAAFWGLEGPSVTYHVVRTDDRFGTSDWGGFDSDHYRRRSVIIKHSSSIR